MALLSLDADLTLTIDGEPATVRSDGDRLVATFASVGAAYRVLKALPLPDGAGRTAAIQMGARRLRLLGLDTDVRVGEHRIARAGPAAAPGPLSRLLRLGEVEVYPGAVVRAWLGRRANR